MCDRSLAHVSQRDSFPLQDCAAAREAGKMADQRAAVAMEALAGADRRGCDAALEPLPHEPFACLLRRLF